MTSSSGEWTDYTVTRKRIKNLRIAVKPPHGQVHVSAPWHVTDSEIAEFVSSKAGWIARHQARIATLPPPVEAGPEAERLRRALKRLLPPLVEEWAERMGVEVPAIRVRRMTTRWGTCNTKTRTVTFNLELARREPELLEYVVVHELAHLRERGHGAAFKAIMDRHLPDWRLLRRALNDGGIAR